MLARHDGTAVDHHAGNVHARQRHRTGGNGLVTTHQRHHAVQAMPARDQLNGVSHQFTRHQGTLHALGTHGYAIGHHDAAELERRAAGFADTFLQWFGQQAQVLITWSDIRPGIDYGNEGLIEFPVTQSGGPQHGSCRSAVRSFFDLVASHDVLMILFKKKPAPSWRGFFRLIRVLLSLCPHLFA